MSEDPRIVMSTDHVHISDDRTSGLRISANGNEHERGMSGCRLPTMLGPV